METYSFAEHKHRYALWTAARAAQRSFTTTKNICIAIEATSLRQFAESGQTITQDEYDQQHNTWCEELIAAFGKTIPCTYGRAAKIIAIYLKTSVILPTLGAGVNALVIHPPIDRILLNNLSNHCGLIELNGKNWTRFSQDAYLQVVSVVRSKFGFFDWRLEVNWQIHEG